MPRFELPEHNIAGFTAEDAPKGTTSVKIIAAQKAIFSDNPIFHVYMAQIERIFLAPLKLQAEGVYKLLIVLQKERTVVYVNDFQELIDAKATRNLKAGEGVTKNDISDIRAVKFPDIEILPTDAVLYCTRRGWKFGLSFDFNRTLDVGIYLNELGQLNSKLFFEDLVLKAREKQNSTHDADLIIFTEGKTDVIHLARAFQDKETPHTFALFEDDDDRGDSVLLDMCEHFSKVPQDKKTLFIFDNDSPNTLKKLLDKTNADGFQDWGNKVFSLIIPKPDFRKENKFVSIELLYKDEQLRAQNVDGRRLYFDNEVVKEISPSKKLLKVRVIRTDGSDINEQDKKVYDQDVDKITDSSGKPVALSKTAFAKCVSDRTPGFESIDYSGFEPLLNLITKVVEGRA